MDCAVALLVGPVMFTAYYAGDPTPKLDRLLDDTRAEAIAGLGCDFIEAPMLSDRRGQRVVVIRYNWAK